MAKQGLAVDPVSWETAEYDGGQQKPGWKLTAGSCAEEKERPEGVNAKGRWGEHEAGKDDAALPLESLQ